MSRLLHGVRRTPMEEAEVASKVQSDSCSICDYCTCASSCWMPQCEKHQCKPEKTVISERKLEGLNKEEGMGEGPWSLRGTPGIDAEKRERKRKGRKSLKGRFMGMMKVVQRKCKGRSSEVNAEKDFMASFGQDMTTTSTRRSLWTSNTKNARAKKTPRLKFAPLPTDHNASCHDVLLSRKPTPCPQRRYVRAQPPKIKKPGKSAARGKDWCKPGRNRSANCVRRKIRNWLHIRKFALRSRVDEGCFWLREKVGRLRAPEACTGEQPRWWRTCRRPVVRERIGPNGYFREFLSDNLEISEEVERVRGGELFGFEGVCQPWGGFHAETWCR